MSGKLEIHARRGDQHWTVWSVSANGDVQLGTVAVAPNGSFLPERRDGRGLVGSTLHATLTDAARALAKDEYGFDVSRHLKVMLPFSDGSGP